jgi:hypothetical protein
MPSKHLQIRNSTAEISFTEDFPVTAADSKNYRTNQSHE